MSKVVLSNTTQLVLRNFASINGSIVIDAGSKLKTINVGENMVALFNCKEQFPQQFAIYDLVQFIDALSIFDDPVLEFDNDSYLRIVSSDKSSKYYFSDPEITLKTAPNRTVNFPGADLEFKMSKEDLADLHRASNVYGLNDISFTSEGDKITINLHDKENETSNIYTQDFAGDSTGDYNFLMKKENLLLYPGNYTVKISKHLITEWKHDTLDLTYWIALEP